MTATSIQPYLFFGGRCQEALDFYCSAAGAEIEMLMLFKDSPDPVPADMLQPGFENKVMHSALRIGGNTLLASDGCSEGSSFGGFSLAFTVSNEAEADRVFNALAGGGQIQMPLQQTFWSPRYGMLTDHFGIAWMIMVAGEAA